MIASRFLGLVVTVVVAGAAGWVLNEQWGTAGESAAKPVPVTEPSASRLPAPRAMPESRRVACRSAPSRCSVTVP